MPTYSVSDTFDRQTRDGVSVAVEVPDESFLTVADRLEIVEPRRVDVVNEHVVSVDGDFGEVLYVGQFDGQCSGVLCRDVSDGES